MAIAASPALAADTLKFGAAPAWVTPQVIPEASDKTKDRPLVLLLHDQQTMLEAGKTTTYAEAAIKIQKPEGLSAGNVSVAWDPASDLITVNKLEIHRGNQVIDVLKSGQTFTTMRRESNLELATLNGVLTANIQPEGLQEGDILVLATTTEHSDPVFKGHVEARFAPWAGAQIGLAHARIEWPSGLNVHLQKTGDLPAAQESVRDGKKVYDLTMRDVEPVIEPKSAPLRFRIGRMGEASDFRSWAEAARVMLPLYRQAAIIPPSGPVRDEIRKIRAASNDPKVQAEQALQLVQQRVRYVALLMGQGGYVPASAETTWSRRFGDCKAKTALLLAVLHELGIEAAAVAVNPFIGDALADRLPSFGLFNHVLVRARIAGKDYWLDGTRTGDTSLDRTRVPNFGWGLPLVDNAALVHIVPSPLEQPDNQRTINIDASAGIYAPAKIEIDELYRGDDAIAYNAGYSQLSADQRTEYLRKNARTYFDGMTVDSTSVQFDKTNGELKIATKGTAKLDWEDRWFRIPSASIAYNPDFDRPAGPLQQVPFATDYPNYETRHVTIRLPPGFLATQNKAPTPVHETLAGVEYARVIGLTGDTMTVDSSERTIAAEVPYKVALAAAARMKSLNNDDVFLRVPNGYRASSEDLATKSTENPASVQDFIDRGLMRLDAGQFDQAISDFDQALALDPKNVWALGDRGIARVWKHDFGAGAKDLAAVEAIDPDNPLLLRAKALQAEVQGKFKAAVDLYTQSLKGEPNNGFALAHRAVARHQIGEDDEALVDAEQALAKNPAAIDLRLMRANILLGQGKRSAVADEADLLMKADPKSNYAFVAAGKIYGRLNMREKALKAFDEALAIKPEAYVYINRAEVRPRSDRAGRIADLEQSLKLDPTNADALEEEAELVALNGDFKQAATLYGRAAKDAPDNSHLKVSHASALYRSGQTAEAQKALAKFEAAARTADDFNRLCWGKATNDILLESALVDCRRAVKLAPDSNQKLDSLGFVLLRLGKFEESVDAYTKAIARKSQSMSLMGRAIAYARKGDKAHAEADRAEALKLDPDAEERFVEYGLRY